MAECTKQTLKWMVILLWNFSSQSLIQNAMRYFNTRREIGGPPDQVWYENRPLGVNKLSTTMKEISKNAGLSRIYTNHSVRATAITLWANAGLSDREIMAISGHHSEASLRSYHQQPSVNQLRKCSDVLTVALSEDERIDAPAGLHHTAARCPLQQIPCQSSAVNSTSANIQITSPTSTYSDMFNSCTIGSVNITFNQ